MLIDVFDNGRQRFLRQFPEDFKSSVFASSMCSFTDALVDGLDFLDNRLHQRAKQSLLSSKWL